MRKKYINPGYYSTKDIGRAKKEKEGKNKGRKEEEKGREEERENEKLKKQIELLTQKIKYLEDELDETKGIRPVSTKGTILLATILLLLSLFLIFLFWSRRVPQRSSIDETQDTSETVEETTTSQSTEPTETASETETKEEVESETAVETETSSETETTPETTMIAETQTAVTWDTEFAYLQDVFVNNTVGTMQAPITDELSNGRRLVYNPFGALNGGDSIDIWYSTDNESQTLVTATFCSDWSDQIDSEKTEYLSLIPNLYKVTIETLLGVRAGDEVYNIIVAHADETQGDGLMFSTINTIDWNITTTDSGLTFDIIGDGDGFGIVVYKTSLG